MNKNIDIIKEIITSRRKKTNCFSFFNEINEWINSNKADLYLIDNNVFIFLQVNGFYKFYYYIDNFKDFEKAKNLLDIYHSKSKVSLEFTTKNDKNLNELTLAANDIGFIFYSEFARLLSGTNVLRSEEKEEEEEDFFELATVNDKKKLLKIMHNEFDIITDNIPTEEELEELINNKCIAIKHIDGEIIYIQIYEYKKGALYSRMTWIKKPFRKPKYTVDIYKGIDQYIKQLNIENYKNLRCYFWVNTNIKNYKINLKQGAIHDGIKCSVFIYSKKKED